MRADEGSCREGCGERVKEGSGRTGQKKVEQKKVAREQKKAVRDQKKAEQ